LAKKRSILDDLLDVGREIAKRLDELLNPEKKRRQLVPVPIPTNKPRK
jgi:hypothetical protein